MLKRHQHLIPHGRDADGRPICPRQPRPAAFGRLRQPRELDLDPAELARVLVVGDHGRDHARASGRGHTSPQLLANQPCAKPAHREGRLQPPFAGVHMGGVGDEVLAAKAIAQFV